MFMVVAEPLITTLPLIVIPVVQELTVSNTNGFVQVYALKASNSCSTLPL